MPRFYAPDFAVDREFALAEEEAHHLSRVLRLAVGDSIVVFDGKGHEATARVESIGSRRVTVRVLELTRPAPEPAVTITLAQSLLKSDKMDRVIRDAVMLGASAIQPIVTKRTDVPRAALKTSSRRERWDRTIISSVKQCGRAVVPTLLEVKDFDQIVTPAPQGLCLMFVEPNGAEKAIVTDLRTLEGTRPPDVMVMIGPEGGWDAREVHTAAASGVTLVTFGARVLRADAAGAAAIAVLRYIWNDL